MPTLIGVSDAQIQPNEWVDHYTNKIGGLPAWSCSNGVIPRCSVCDGELSLIVQLYCPLEGSHYHRTLYVFGCSSPMCWNKSDSWIAFRCQVLDEKYALNAKSKTTTSTTTAAADDDDWGAGGDDWGVDADDWGDSELDPTSPDISTSENNTDKSKGNLDSTVTYDQQGEEVGYSIDDLNIQQMCIEDVEDPEDRNEEDKNINNTHIIAEDLPSGFDENKIGSIKSLTECQTRPSDLTKVLVSYFIDVFDEPTNQKQDDGHVTELLRNYQKQEGIQSIEKCMRSGEGGATGGGGGGEKYEKAMLVHKDAVFHKFVKRLSVCPEQCVRYEWNGSPLYMRQTTVSDIPTLCDHCQGPVVFELQLMPALVNILRFPGYKGTPLEFGTVIVYTCKQSCWEPTDSYRTEKVLVQADPDQDRFSV